MKILLTGSEGQLSYDLLRVLKNHDVYPLSHTDLNVTDTTKLEAILSSAKYEVVINTAAYHRVDEIEGNIEAAFNVNAFSPYKMALLCKSYNLQLVHISTDYVFGGDNNTKRPYRETDPCKPVNVYGFSKLTGEQLIALANPAYYIVRTSGLYGIKGPSGKGSNFIERMIIKGTSGEKIRVVNDQILTPTYTLDLAYAIEKLLHSGKYGLYHVTNEGSCSWYDFTREIFKALSMDVKVEAISTSDSGASAKRPGYSVLSKSKLYAAGLPKMRDWKIALRAYLVEQNYLPASVRTSLS
jgi:dTDP-4-dehydrorhamnose reductase